ncbi:MAG: hypothetical protein WKF84_28635 [Pyrinomonadaceae bacterium]
MQSIRGTKGGYKLARPAGDSLKLARIIKVLDDNVVEGHCKSYTGVLESCVHTGNLRNSTRYRERA